MKTSIVAIVGALALLAGCGGSSDENDGGTTITYTMSSGSYTVSNLAKADSDTCQLFNDLQGIAVAAAVNGQNLQMDWQELTGDHIPVGTINGNEFTAAFTATAMTLPGTTCQISGNRTFTGTLTGDNQFEGRFVNSIQVISGGADCVTAGITPLEAGCTSTLTFHAAK